MLKIDTIQQLEIFQIDIDRSFITDFFVLAIQIIMLLHNVSQNI